MVRTSSTLTIVHMSNALRFDGTGHTNSTVDLAATHSRRGHRVILVCRDTDEEMRAFAERHRLQLVDGLGASTVGEAMRSVRRLRPLLRSAEIIHLHTVRSVALGLLAAPVSMLRRSVATLHNPHQPSTALMLTARRVVAMSRAHARHVRRRTAGIVRAVVVQNGTLRSPRRAAIEDVRARILEGRPIVFVGALHRRKGLDVLLEAMVEVVRVEPRARLHVVGNRDAPEFEESARNLGLADHVRFDGYVADPRELVLAAEVFVLPSREEGFGNVLTEARECGTPIIASAVGGIPEALEGGRAGHLVPAEDPQALAAAIVRVLGEPAFATALVEAGRADLERMSVERAADEYETVYRSIGARRTNRR